MTSPSLRKRSLSPACDPSPKRSRPGQPSEGSSDLLAELTGVLAEIESTPSSGELSAELLENLKLVMLQIEQLSSDASNPEAIQMRHETDRCLETWFDDLVARCEADGELDLDRLEQELAAAGSDEEDDDDEDVALGIALSLEDQAAEQDEQGIDVNETGDADDGQIEVNTPVRVIV